MFPLNFWLDGFYDLERPKIAQNVTQFNPRNVYRMPTMPTAPPYVPNITDFSPKILTFLPNPELQFLLYPLMPILLQSKLVLIGLAIVALVIISLSYFFICFEIRVLSAMVSFMTLALSGITTLFLLSALYFDQFDIMKEIALFQMQYVAYQYKNTSMEILSFSALQEKNQCCGIAGPGDYTTNSQIVTFLTGDDVAPNWILDHGFAVDRPKPVPTQLTPPGQTPPTGVTDAPGDNKVIAIGEGRVLKSFTNVFQFFGQQLLFKLRFLTKNN
mgnify:CR=1 FL=1